MGEDEGKSKPKRDPYKVALLGDGLFDRSSRLAVYFTEIGSELVFPDRKTMMNVINCDEQQLSHSIWVLTHQWQLWRWDKTIRRYRRVYVKGERDKEGIEVKAKGVYIPKFKLRVQRTIDKRVALRWVLTDLTRKGGLWHTYDQFAAQLETGKSVISRYMTGYRRRSDGRKVPGLLKIMDLSRLDD